MVAGSWWFPRGNAHGRFSRRNDWKGPAGFGSFQRPIALAHPVFVRPHFFAHRTLGPQPFFQRHFVDGRFFVRHRRFVAPFVGAGGYGVAYDDSYYDSDYGDDCYLVIRHVVNRLGYAVWRRNLVCSSILREMSK